MKIRTIGGVNGVACITIALLVIGFLSLAGYQIFKEVARKRYVESVVNVESGTPINATWRLGTFEHLPKTNFLMAPASSAQDYQISYYEKEASATRNYLFLNQLDLSAHWLLKTSKYLFLSAEKLHQTEGNVRDEMKPDAKEVKWIEYEVVKTDSNGDRRLTDKDRLTIAISSASGDDYTELVENIDEVLGARLRDENTLLIFYRTGEKRFAVEANLLKKQITLSKELPSFLQE